MKSYRNRIYESYASGFKNVSLDFDPVATAKWGKAYNWYLRKWLPEYKDAAIIDLGCGDGKLLYFFKQRGYTNVSGVDISPEQVKLARNVITTVTEGNLLEFLQANPNKFDLITGLDIVEHLTKEEVVQFLDECQRALCHNGRIILQTPNANSPFGMMVRYGDLTHEICFSSMALRSIMRFCGFENLESREMGPVPWGYSMISTIRFLIWQWIRFGLKVFEITETGSSDNVFTRVQLVSGIKNKR